MPNPTIAPSDPTPADRRVRHGLRSRQLFIHPDDQDRFIKFRHRICCELQPRDQAEEFLVEQIVANRWMILHADEAEAAAMRNAYLDSERFSEFKSGLGPSHAPKSEFEVYDRALAATLTADSVQLILRYRAAHERALLRMEKMFAQYRNMREARELRLAADPDAADRRADHQTNYHISPGASAGQSPPAPTPPSASASADSESKSTNPDSPPQPESSSGSDRPAHPVGLSPLDAARRYIRFPSRPVPRTPKPPSAVHRNHSSRPPSPDSVPEADP